MKKVIEFIEKSKQEPTTDLGARLMLEELLETLTALGLQASVNLSGKWSIHPVTVAGVGRKEVDVVEAIDGLCDVVYTAMWTAYALGIDLTPFFEEVCDNNLLKVAGEVEFDENGKLVKPKGHPRPRIKEIYRDGFGPRFARSDSQEARFVRRWGERDLWQTLDGMYFLQGPVLATYGLGRRLSDLSCEVI